MRGTFGVAVGWMVLAGCAASPRPWLDPNLTQWDLRGTARWRLENGTLVHHHI